MNRNLVGELKAVVERLASDAPTQTDYLVNLGVAPSADELGLEFDDAFACATASLSEGQQASLQALNELLDGMSGESNAALWTVESLAHAQEWRQVREQARAALKLL